MATETATRALTAAIARRFTSGEDFGGLVDSVAQELAELDRGAATISLLSDDGRWLQTVGYHESDPDARARFEAAVLSPQSVEGRAIRQVVATGEPLLVAQTTPEDVAEALPPFAEYAHAVGVSGYAIVPLKARGNVLGTLGISRSDPDRPYSEEDLEALAELGDVLALGIGSALPVETARR